MLVVGYDRNRKWYAWGALVSAETHLPIQPTDLPVIHWSVLQTFKLYFLIYPLPQGAYHYDLEVSPADGLLYVAHAERRQVRATTSS